MPGTGYDRDAEQVGLNISRGQRRFALIVFVLSALLVVAMVACIRASPALADGMPSPSRSRTVCSAPMRAPGPADNWCQEKKQCGEIRTCGEAVYRLRTCGDHGDLDRDHDGVPCEGTGTSNCPVFKIGDDRKAFEQGPLAAKLAGERFSPPQVATAKCSPSRHR